MRSFERDSWPHLVACAADVGRSYLTTALARAQAQWWRVQVGRGCRFYGLPIMRRLPGTTIQISERCVFRSAEWSNMAGVNRRCVVATVGAGASIQIGRASGFSATVIAAASSIHIGQRVMAGVNCMISDTDWHPLDPQARATGGYGKSRPIVIEDDVWLCANVVVLKGVTIGAGTTVAANSVVTQDLPPGVLAGGIPARRIAALTDIPQEI